MKHVRLVVAGILWVPAAFVLTAFLDGAALTAAQKEVVVINTPAAPVPVTGTVQIINPPAAPVPVTGTVEVVDRLHEPFLELASVSLPQGTLVDGVTFDVPEGKRLVLETLSLQISVPATQRVRAFLDVRVGNSAILSFIPVQSPGSILGTEYFIANQPFKLRKDAIPGATDEIRVRMLRDGALGSSDLLVTLHGYLVDLN
jgi:hypothetical protein